MMKIQEFVSDNRGRIEVAIFLILVIAGMCLITPHAHAAPLKMVNFSDMQYNPNITVATTVPPTLIPIPTPIQESYVVVETEIPPMVTPNPIPTNIAVGRRIDQGACVQPGETIDIAGLGWYTGYLTYYGRYYDGLSGENSSWQASYYADYRNLTNFYLEPYYFDKHYGYWYIDNYIDGERGNARVFRVAEHCVLAPKENQTVVQEAINQSKIFMAYVANKSVLPIKYEPSYDIIVSKNVTTTIKTPNNTKTSWMFGINSNVKFYDKELNQETLTLDKWDTVGLPEGQYDIIYISPGRNGIVEEHYDPKTFKITSPFRSQEDTDLYGINSRTAEEWLINKVSNSYDDSITKTKVMLQDPKIEIKKIDQMSLSNNHSFVVITGYTNANGGDTLTVTFDKDSVNPNRGVSRNWNAPVFDPMGLNAYRVWNTSFIIDFNTVPPGMHYFTVTSKDGASATVPIYRRVELAGHYIPPEEMGFFSNSPFIPTPTPQIIKEIQTVPVTIIQTITIPVTPTQESVDAAWWNGMLKVAAFATGVIIVGYLLVAYARSKTNRRMKY